MVPRSHGSAEQPVPKRTGEKPEVVRVRLLGGFRMWVREHSVGENEWRLRKAQGLIKLLALAPAHRMHRGRVMDLLWPDLDDKAASNNLHQALHVARRTLEPDAATFSSYLRLHDELLELCPNDRLWVDVEAFEKAAEDARRSEEPAAYRSALELYTGDLLPEDRYETWAQERREGLRLSYLSLLMEMGGLYESRGNIGATIEALQKVVAAEPTHEEAHAGLMRLYAGTGWRHRALDQYERLRQALHRKLNAEPGARSKRLHEEILAGNVPTIQTPPPRAEPPSVTEHNLPIPLTSFVGREKEVAAVEQLLGATRLLTLTGTGGCGKTRLMLEAARDLAAAYPDGAWLVELAPLVEEALVPQAVARVVGVREQPGRPLTNTLVDHLRDKELLLILDNCEHLVDACARLVETLLDSCSGLRFLATSREVLGASGEVSWRVPPLSGPGPQHPNTLEELEGYESVRLFVNRARYRDSSFALSPHNARAVAEICARLEGVPLAIELAAARVELSVEEIAQRLDDSLKLLTAGRQTATFRQRTLRGALDWSHELLSAPEKRLFERLSVFAGGWTLEATEVVGAGDEVEGDEVLDLVSRLADKSLVVTGGSGARYRMLEPVRQYAREKLKAASPGEAQVIRRRHAEYYLALVEEAEPELTGREQPEWLQRLELEHDNLRAALKYFLPAAGTPAGPEGAEAALRLAGAVWMFWHTHGHLSEGRAWLERAISAGGAPRVEAKALNGVGWISMFQGDYEAARTFFERGLTLFRELGDEDGIVTCITNLGLVAVLGERRDIPVSIMLKEAAELRPKLTNPRTVANLLILSGLVAFAHGDVEQAWTLHEESLEISRRIGDPGVKIVCLTNLGLMAVGRGDYARALALLRENLYLARRSDDKVPLQYALFGLAGAAAAQRKPVRAARLWGASETVREVAGLHLTALARTGTNYDAHLEDVRAQLGEVAFAKAWGEGKTMTQEAAIEYALSEETSPAPESAPDALTEREWEVALLVARGLANRRIAKELSISERTVHGHVRKILKKLELRSRAQLAAWVTEHRLQDAAGRA
jgi:predicted ATPase/DNA-binding SARP family transcriptional activator/DNA-binding CsgD family transcriptional regulator